MDTSSPSLSPHVRGNVLRRHAWFYDIVVALMTFTSGRHYIRLLLDEARLVPGERVLDLGCGTGSLALGAALRVGPSGQVHGVDASAQMLARARRKARRVPQVQFTVGTVEALPFPAATFDVAFSTLMLHHLPKPARLACLQEAHRVLEPVGRIVVSDFETPARSRTGPLARLHRHGGVTLGGVGNLLASAGFRPLRSGPLGVQDLHYTVAAKA